VKQVHCPVCGSEAVGDQVMCSACGQVLRSTGRQRFSLGSWEKWAGGALVAVGLPGSLLAGFLVVRGLVEGTVASAFGLDGGAALGVGLGVGFVSVCFLLIGASLLRPDAEPVHDVGGWRMSRPWQCRLCGAVAEGRRCHECGRRKPLGWGPIILIILAIFLTLLIWWVIEMQRFSTCLSGC
jgi:predicted nucleic acid-binding Zn ribbon protein